MAASVAALVAWCMWGVTTLKTMFLDFECSWPKIFPPTTEQQGTDLRRVNHLEYPLAEVRTEDKRPPPVLVEEVFRRPNSAGTVHGRSSERWSAGWWLRPKCPISA